MYIKNVLLLKYFKSPILYLPSIYTIYCYVCHLNKFVSLMNYPINFIGFDI